MQNESLPSLVSTVLAINEEQSAAYVAAQFARRRHWAVHPTFFCALKCMDGRLNLSEILQIPIGLIKPLRSIGGRFEIYWPTFMKRLRFWIKAALNNPHPKGTYSCIFVTYHFSASDNEHLGCAGWHHDTEAAKAHAEKISRDLREIYLDQVIPIVTGIETDRDILILHGQNGDVRGDELVGLSEEEILQRLRSCFPNLTEFPQIVLDDLVPFLMGNARHIASLGDRTRDQSVLGHNERIIAVGQGFDWLAARNRALIINDATVDLRKPIKTAARIIENNLKNAPQDRALIFTSVPYEDLLEERIARARSIGLQEFAQEVIREEHPELWNSGRLDFLVGITEEHSKKLTLVKAGSIK